MFHCKEFILAADKHNKRRVVKFIVFWEIHSISEESKDLFPPITS
jgi:hypothetical protein